MPREMRFGSCSWNPTAITHKRLMNTKEDVIHLGGTWSGILREGFTPARGRGDLWGRGHGTMKGQMTEMAERRVQFGSSVAGGLCGRRSWRALSQTLEKRTATPRRAGLAQHTVGHLSANVPSRLETGVSKPQLYWSIPETTLQPDFLKHRAPSCLWVRLLLFPQAGTLFCQPLTGWLLFTTLQEEAQIPLPLRQLQGPHLLNTSSPPSSLLSY